MYVPWATAFSSQVTCSDPHLLHIMHTFSLMEGTHTSSTKYDPSCNTHASCIIVIVFPLSLFPLHFVAFCFHGYTFQLFQLSQAHIFLKLPLPTALGHTFSLSQEIQRWSDWSGREIIIATHTDLPFCLYSGQEIASWKNNPLLPGELSLFTQWMKL